MKRGSRIIIIGKGHLGSILAGYRFELRPADFINPANVTHWKDDMSALDERALADIQPSFVINAAGKTDLPWCEANKDECWRCNVVEPIMLQRRLSRETTLVHLSSGCVWQGPFRADGQPFLPTDPPTPACFYAWTKAMSDSQLMTEASDAKRSLVVLRPRQVYSGSPSPRNTLSKLLSYEKLIDSPNSMTSARIIAKVIEGIMTRGAYDERRIMNVYDRGVASPFMVGMLLAKAGLRKEPLKMEKSELDSWHKPRRVDVVMNDPFFEDNYQYAIRRVELELTEAIREFKVNQTT